MYSIHSCFRLRRWFWLLATKTILRRAPIILERPQPERRVCRVFRVPQRRIQEYRERRGNQARREHRVQVAAAGPQAPQGRQAEQHRHLSP